MALSISKYFSNNTIMAGMNQTPSGVSTDSFDKQLNEDVKDFHAPSNSWTQARNAINNSQTGDLGDLGNEPANLFCARAPYPIIGAIHLFADKWVVFSTDDTDNEIALFEEDTCNYRVIVNDPCLNFKLTNLIIGVSKENSDCTWQIYWIDAVNPDRTMCIGQPENWPTNPVVLWPCVPWVQSCSTVNDCLICVDTQDLDCAKIRLAPLVKVPCFHLSKGTNSGTMPNGSYFVVIAYTIDQQKFTDYYGPSNIQALFDHKNVAGSLDITITDIDQSYFDEFELVLVSIVNQQTVARKVGIYSVRTSLISIDIEDNSLPTVPLEQIPIQTPVMDKSDGMYEVGDYLLRVGPTSKFDFNYQPLANQIVAKWASVEYPSDYYRKGGNQVGHMRDEIYPFFIRWLYDTGDKSASYHIPGRAPFPTDFLVVGGPDTAPEVADGLTPYNWIVNNTATVTNPVVNIPAPDGVGLILSEGFMGYWESTEEYDDNRPDIWNAGVIVPPYPGTNPLDYDLCGHKIRHHRFPDNALHPTVNHHNAGGTTIRVMGIKFENILPPVDNIGVLISGIVGYEILRGTRDGNRSVIAKGIINNMGQYVIPGGITPRTGAYPNYPYNDLNPDVFLSTGATSWDACNPIGPSTGENGYVPQNNFARDLFSFHSPETNFNNPFLSTKEIKVYGQFVGTVNGKFEYPDKHPKFKLVTNLSFFISAIAGVGIASLAMNGERRVSRTAPYYPGYSAIAPAIGGLAPNPVTYAAAIGAITPFYIPGGAIDNLNTATTGGVVLLSNVLGLNTNLAYNTFDTGSFALAPFSDLNQGTINIQQQDGQYTYVPTVFRALQAIPTFTYYWSEGVDTTLRLIKSILRFRQFALQYHSHGFYSLFGSPVVGNRRRVIEDSAYIDPHITDFGTNYRINNLFRSRHVAIKTTTNIGDPTVVDLTRLRASDVPALFDFDGFFGIPRLKDPTKEAFASTTSCHYVGLKQRLRNQYGQIDGIRQVPTSVCETLNPQVVTAGVPFPPSEVFFNGDIYVGRYTEKNTFFFFFEWLYGQPDGYEYDYYKRKMLLFPRYWINSESFEASDFLGSFLNNPLTPAAWTLPNDYYNLDGLTCTFLNLFHQPFAVREAYFYLFNSGVRDFFVETEVNVDLRDWGEADAERHYDPYRYTDTKAMFDVAIIKSGNFYKYDVSLGASKTWTQFLSWGAVQARSYDPNSAQSCFVHRPNRVIYSLPQQLELEKDNWRIFLANNYKDFKSRVTSVKPINKSGALIMFYNESPVQFQGLDQLETDLNTKLTIGDGGLFSQPMQSISNADSPYEYGSCQNRLSAINTPAGMFWMSANQGKIFQLYGGLNEISMQSMKWWFAEYLPYRLLKQFPNFELQDNPVVGIGCQAVYDNENSLVYFCKRDYVVRKDITNVITYVSSDDFLVDGILSIKLGDPRFFEDASWTISYDPKTKGWLSYHDWHPDLLMPGKNTFMSVSRKAANLAQTNGIWKHNLDCSKFCNYYGEDFPFEVEFTVHTVQMVNTMRSVEYMMEVYRYDNNCFDRFHVLDFNFDEAVVYNTEQCSGLLRLNLTPKNNAPLIVQYPQVNPTNIDILYSKEEQKYRFNQFWDITDSRGEFPIGSPYPPQTMVGSFAERMIWNTAENGYVRTLNPANLNYNKNQLERKKFRHYMNSVLLRRRISGDRKMLVMIANVKNLNSPR
jgi:hypothetical protein